MTPSAGGFRPVNPLNQGVEMSDQKASLNESTGAGAEAAEGIHSADSPKDETKKTAAPKPERQGDGDPVAGRRGSEPTTSHPTEHQSNYGGGGENGGSGRQA